MISCPICQLDNPPGVDACVRCGKRFIVATEPSAGAATPLPAPMVEPITNTIPIAPTAPLPGSVLRKGLPAGGSGSVVAAITARAPIVAAVAEVIAADPRLIVVRGERLNVAYPILDGKNYIGRSADSPVDIDLDGQEAVERIWISRQHAVISWERGELVLEDLNSLNGTFVNRTRIHPGQPRLLQPNDIVQIGTVQLKVML